MNTGRQNPSNDGGGSDNSMESTVFDNFGIDPSTDFGNEDAGDNDGSDLDQGSDDLGSSDNQNDELDALGDVTQTRQQERQPRQQEPRQRDELRPIGPNAGIKADAKGNLINAAGQIVARAGKEARLYQQARRSDERVQGLQAHATNVEQRLSRALEIANGLVSENDQYKARESQIQKFGLSSEEHLEALTLYAQNKTNPTQFIKNLLTRAAARGINVNEIMGGGGQFGQPGGFDPSQIAAVLKEGLEAGLAPVRTLAETQQQERERLTQDAQAQERTRNEVQDFFNKNVEARPYMKVFTQVLADPQFQHMSLGEIWLRIQLNQARRGNGSGLRQNPRQNPQQRRGIPSGRGSPGGQRQAMPNGADQVAPVSQSYDAILRQTMTDYGM
jgi:hypothetical protein